MEAGERLKWWERCILWAFGIIVVLFGAITLQRSALMDRRMGDVGVFFRAGWAAREGGEQLYTITCNNGWHFHYPPIVSCLFMPFADPPPWADPCTSIPFGYSVIVWYVISLLCLAIGLHLLASALEASMPGGPPATGSRHWWSLRFAPLVVCLPCVGSTIVRGQITPLLFALIAATLAAGIRGRRLTSGLWLAASICVKIFPGFLAIVPLWQRDRRCLAGIAVGLVLGLAILPAGIFGPDRTVACYREYMHSLISPALGIGQDQSRATELLNATATDNQAIVSAVNSLIHLERGSRPHEAAPLARGLHWLIGGCMTLITLWSFRRIGPLSPEVESQRALLLGGSLVVIMMLICPVCHLHYFMLTLPVILALVAVYRGASVHLPPGLVLLFGIHMLTVILAQMPALAVLKDKCLPSYGVLLLWAVACATGHRLGRQPVGLKQSTSVGLRCAA